VGGGQIPDQRPSSGVRLYTAQVAAATLRLVLDVAFRDRVHHLDMTDVAGRDIHRQETSVRTRPDRSQAAAWNAVAPTSATRRTPRSAAKLKRSAGRPPVEAPLSAELRRPALSRTSSRWLTVLREEPLVATTSARDKLEVARNNPSIWLRPTSDVPCSAARVDGRHRREDSRK
jgi:hypothetical protein